MADDFKEKLSPIKKNEKEEIIDLIDSDDDEDNDKAL